MFIRESMCGKATNGVWWSDYCKSQFIWLPHKNRSFSYSLFFATLYLSALAKIVQRQFIQSCALVFPVGAGETANEKCFDPTDGNFPLTSLCRYHSILFAHWKGLCCIKKISRKTCRLCCQEDRFNCDNDPRLFILTLLISFITFSAQYYMSGY